MKSLLLTITCLLLIMIGTGIALSISTDDGWSSTVNGIQSRLTLVQKKEHNGTRWLVPYLELRNVREPVNQIEINCDRNHLTMVSTDSGAWVLEDAEKGKVFLRATVTNEPIETSFNNWKRWYGTIRT